MVQDPPTEKTLSFDAFASTRYFECFDGLRAIAVLWVVLFHCPRFGPTWFREWLESGDLGVDLFFVMSGFLITTLILREPPEPAGKRLFNFYARRSLRIFPVYYLAIGIYYLGTRFASADKLDVFVEYIPSFALYICDIKLAFAPTPFPPLGHAWSLAVEEKYYLLWPWFAVLLSERRACQMTILFILIGNFARFWVTDGFGGDIEARLYYGFDTRFDALMWGSLLAFMLRNPRVFEFLRRLARPSMGLVSIAILFVYGSLTHNASLIRYVGIPLVCMSVITCYLLAPAGVASTLLKSRPFQFIGRVSYGIYIFHPLGISAAARVFGKGDGPTAIGVIILGTAISLIIAHLSFQYFEMWFLRLKHRYR